MSMYVYDCVCSGYMCVPCFFAVPINTTVTIPDGSTCFAAAVIKSNNNNTVG